MKTWEQLSDSTETHHWQTNHLAEPRVVLGDSGRGPELDYFCFHFQRETGREGHLDSENKMRVLDGMISKDCSSILQGTESLSMTKRKGIKKYSRQENSGRCSGKYVQPNSCWASEYPGKGNDVSFIPRVTENKMKQKRLGKLYIGKR